MRDPHAVPATKGFTLLKLFPGHDTKRPEEKRNCLERVLGTKKEYVRAGHKPGSVPRNSHLPRDNDHSSSFDVTIEIKRPTRELGRTTLPVPLFGLAPGGVYLAPVVTGRTGELLPHLFTLTRWRGQCRATRRSVFCGTFLPVAGTGCYPAPCPVETGLSSPLPEGKAAIICPALTYADKMVSQFCNHCLGPYS